MIKCICGNSFKEGFTKEDLGEYKCRECGKITYTPYDNTNLEIALTQDDYNISIEIVD